MKILSSDRSWTILRFTRTSAVAERPRDAACCWKFPL